LETKKRKIHSKNESIKMKILSKIQDNILIQKIKKNFNIYNWSLQFQMQFLVVSLAFVCFVFIGFYAYKQADNVVKKETVKHIQSINILSNKMLENHLHNIENTLQFLSQSAIAQEGFQDLKKSFLEKRNQISQDTFQIFDSSQIQSNEASNNDYSVYKENLKNYYQGIFLYNFNRVSLEKKIIEEVLPTDSVSIFWQYQYIGNNAYDTDKKHLLNNSGDGSTYSTFHEFYHLFFKNFLQLLHIEDIYLIDCQTSYVIYSSQKKPDFAIQLRNSKYSNLLLTEIYKKAILPENNKLVCCTDFTKYMFAQNSSISLFSSGIYENDTLKGLIVFQVGSKFVTNILAESKFTNELGLEKSGETFLVGNDYYLRSSQRGFLENKDSIFLLLENKNFAADSLLILKRQNTDVLNIEYRNYFSDKNIFHNTGVFDYKDFNNTDWLAAFSAFPYKDQSWSIITQIKASDKYQTINQLKRNIFIFSLLFIVIGFFIVRYFTQLFFKPIENLNTCLQNLKEGKIYQLPETKGNNELTNIIGNIQIILNKIETATEFIKQVEAGNYSTQLPVSNNNDKLAIALNNMMIKLVEMNEASKLRRMENQVQQWKSKGIEIINDVLRNSTKNYETFLKEILTELTKYVEATVATMFLIQKKEGENSHIEQVSTVANYKYYKTKKIIQLNEGLVGRCIFEKKHIILTEIPENYIEISSGLGTAKPRNLLIAPLQNDSEILGALEFATFQIFENHVIDFILMVAEDITTTLQNIYINNKTNELLQESRLNAKRNEENDKKYQQIILKSKNKMNEMLEREKQLVEENERLKRQISDFEQKKNKPS